MARGLTQRVLDLWDSWRKMSKRYLFSIALSIAAITILSFFFEIMGLISYGLIIISVWVTIAIIIIWLVTCLLSKLHIAKKTFRLRSPLKFPLFLFVSGVAGILFMNLYAPPALPPPTFSVNDQLSYMYKTDQGDRLALRFLKLNKRDQERLERVVELHEQEVIKSPENLYQAATILQHGTKSEHYELAYILAKQASETGYDNAEGLWKAAYDRWMLSLGKSQEYGTQSTATFTFFGISIEQK